MSWSECTECGDLFPIERQLLGYDLCLACGEAEAREARKSWCILTPHKQGAMFFTAESARDIAKGINNKGGLYR